MHERGGMLLSVPFLLATALIYATVPELRNLHGLCLIMYCAGLIVAYTLLAYLKLTVTNLQVNMTACQVLHESRIREQYGYKYYASFRPAVSPRRRKISDSSPDTIPDLDPAHALGSNSGSALGSSPGRVLNVGPGSGLLPMPLYIAISLPVTAPICVKPMRC
ncbi:G-protein coupled receptor Mth2 [Eumeta japonica]|uniref:G-protein coupled receptor Mth2 n=1 Tax=Eumeta variegata TaxID=151549 RepID=A0A4C1WH90_EUMVA|nr:G-protein coupled receptor Mth2 [Eumeta japonica]